MTFMKTISVEQSDDTNFRYYGGLRLDDAVEVLEDILVLKSSEVLGFQKCGARIIKIGITEKAFYRNSVQDVIDRSDRIVLASARIIQVGLPNSSITEVFIKHAPMEWPSERLERIFSCYGNIKKIDRLEVRKGDITRNDDYIGKVNGVTKIRMKIRKQIPSSMVIDSERIEVYYKNQALAC